MFINAVYHIIWQCDAHLIPLADVTLKAGIALNHTMKKINTYPKLFMSVCMSSVELGIGLLMKRMFFGIIQLLMRVWILVGGLKMCGSVFPDARTCN